MHIDENAVHLMRGTMRGCVQGPVLLWGNWRELPHLPTFLIFPICPQYWHCARGLAVKSKRACEWTVLLDKTEFIVTLLWWKRNIQEYILLASSQVLKEDNFCITWHSKWQVDTLCSLKTLALEVVFWFFYINVLFCFCFACFVVVTCM